MNRRAVYASLLLATASIGCRSRTAAPKLDASAPTPSTTPRAAAREPKRVIPIKGFDPEGEPEIREMPDGSLELVFNFMPPTWAEDEKAWAGFDQEIARAIGTDVFWEDREFLIIRRPRSDTIERLQRFLAQRAAAARRR